MIMPNAINLDEILMGIMELLYKLKSQKSYWIGASGNQLSVPWVSFYGTHALSKKHQQDMHMLHLSRQILVSLTNSRYHYCHH